MQYDKTTHEPTRFDNYEEFLGFVLTLHKEEKLAEMNWYALDDKFITPEIQKYILSKVNIAFFQQNPSTIIKNRKSSDLHYHTTMMKHLQESIKHLRYFGLDDEAQKVQEILTLQEFNDATPKIVSKNNLKDDIKATLFKEISENFKLNKTDTNSLVSALTALTA